MANDKSTLIIETARTLFIEHGFHGTSMQMLAKAADIAAGTLYVHFTNKADLIRSIFRTDMRTIVDQVLQDHDASLPLFDQYRQFWINGYSGLVHRPHHVLYKDLYEHSPFYSDEDNEWCHTLWQPIDTFFQKGIDCGLFRHLPLTVLAFSSLGSVMNIPHLLQIVPGLVLTPDLQNQLIDASWQSILRR